MTKVLVIENEQQTRGILLDCLKTEGFETIEAQNGRVGVQKAGEHLPDVVICDILMPDLHGYEVLKLLKQNSSTSVLPFIFLTDKNTKSDLRQAMELGADDCLIKPFTREELLGAIVSQLKRQAMLKQWLAMEYQGISQIESKDIDEFANSTSLFASCPQLRKIFDFIEAHYHESISLRDVAEYMALSSAYLTHLVGNRTGETINRWIMKRRVTAARVLLLKTDDPVEQIALQVGYRSQNHFFRQFRQYYGNSPHAWRKQHRSKTRLSSI